MDIAKAILPLLFFLCNYISVVFAQPLNKTGIFSHADTLRGVYGAGRDWWDVVKYDLHVNFNIGERRINGYNRIDLKILKKGDFLQIDLQDPLVMDSIFFSTGKSPQRKLDRQLVSKDGSAYFIPAKDFIQPGVNTISLIIYYHGSPVTAKYPPWDGGIIWDRDAKNNPWVTIACQGLGASVWYPCKDHQADEPERAEMYFTCPDSLVAVSNGRFRDKESNKDGTTTYHWAVENPINNYLIIPYIGNYAHFTEVYKGEKGRLDMDYWVMDYNLEKARKQFTDAPRMMKAFEYWFGPYPFYEDGYKLVESSHLGMEHQSAIAYGNGFENGYLGKDLSSSGWGLKWDFIIVHESGHEWFANNITVKDIADVWVHEGFTNYSETLFTEYYYGKKAATEYITGIRNNIRNDIPIIGPYNVNKEGSVDMYYKAANMIHTIRQIINDDSLFRKILRGLNTTFYHQTVTSKQVEDYICKLSGKNFSKVFDQYLRTIQVPTLEFRLNGQKLSYRYANCLKGFNMPLKINFAKDTWIKPTDAWQTLDAAGEKSPLFSVDPNFYINVSRID